MPFTQPTPAAHRADSHTRFRRAALVVGLLMFWWASQWLGLLHAVQHPQVEVHGAVQAAALELASATPTASEHDHGLHWGHDEGSPTCELLTHLLCDPAVCLAASTPPCSLPTFALFGATKPAWPPTVWLQAHPARGPPRASSFC